MIAWPQNQEIITSGNVMLRPFNESDVADVFDACQDPLISQFTPVPYPYERSVALDFVRASHFTFLDRVSINYAIIEVDPTGKKPSSFAGTVGLHSMQQRDHMTEIGYWMEKSHRGRGICTQAVALLSEFAIETMGFRRIEALADVENIASHKVLEGAGFTRDAVVKNRTTRPNGRQIDMALYSKISKTQGE